MPLKKNGSRRRCVVDAIKSGRAWVRVRPSLVVVGSNYRTDAEKSVE